MSVRQRAAAAVQRRSMQRVCVAAAIVAAGSAAVSIEAGAASASSSGSSSGEQLSSPEQPSPTEVRRIAVTPADRTHHVAEPEAVDELTAALVALYERHAVASTEPGETPAAQQEPAARVAAEFGGEVEEGPTAQPETITTTQVPLETWEAVARCESGYGGEPDWSIDTGNGYYGGLQFHLDSWRWVGGTGYPHEASKATQIEMAERLWERQGWDAWPACSRELGLR